MSGRLSLQPAELLARLKSRRVIAGIAIAVLALGGGGYYFCSHSPDAANAMIFRKPVALSQRHRALVVAKPQPRCRLTKRQPRSPPKRTKRLSSSTRK